MKILDRYILRETLPPFFLALSVFTFLFGIKPMLENAQGYLAKGVDLPTVGFLLMLLLPQALGITIPMAFLTGLLMALGRFSGDRESVALQACGVSPLRLLRPVFMAAAVAGLLNFYVLWSLVPDSNQRWREETYQLLVKQSEGDIKAGKFYEGFPGKVLFVREMRPGGGWLGVMLADVSKPGRPLVTIAEQGYLDMNPTERSVSIVLPGRSERHIPGDQPGVYDRSEQNDVRIKVPADEVFGDGSIGLSRGLAEMSYADLEVAAQKRIAAGLSPHNEIFRQQQMFSFPIACFVLAILGLALGLHTRKDGKFGGFTVGIVVILLYYGLMVVVEGRAMAGAFPAIWARWVPNIALGIIGIAAIWWRTHASGRELAIQAPAWLRRRAAAAKTGVAPGQAQRAVADRRGVILVIRLPDFSLPAPRILDVYVGSRYVRVALVAFFGLLSLFYVGTLIDKSSKLFKGQADLALMFEFFYYSTPQYVVHLVPMAVLVAALATIGGLTRSGELIVMRACGVSLYRVAMPLFLLALVWSGGLFLVDDRVLAKANQRAEELDYQIRHGEEERKTISPVANTNWRPDPRGAVYYYLAYDIPKKTLYGLNIFELGDRSSKMTSYTTASRAKFVNGEWHGEDGWVQRFTGQDRITREAFNSRVLDLSPPESFSGTQNTDAELMPYSELSSHIGRLAASGINMAESRVRLESRLAFPLVTIVMTLLGVPFGVTTGRRGALYGIGLAIILAAAYWLTNTVFIAFGQADLLPPMLAAWAANILFLAMAAYMTLTVRT